ncbi:heterokaryon incompatibility protein-domain-containing protein [Lasiosphaeria hispida]|uniref:Heterokaryon incompatibility protein-domain-containing protein n=1 Tax=Lasiosphaeria hispida TaxID=260671 RepID=A0AAJ0HJW0_9PEZI|nr:heterokaryon incompatibility protein-domain-containing protein [Lasiosphaeria hispida]
MATPTTPKPAPDLYSPLNTTTREIRLIGTKSASSSGVFLQTFPLATAPPYHALSYMWGNPSPAIDMEIHGHSVAVTRNLHDALMALWLRPDVRYVWIDALCINQASPLEKQHQVPLMDRIYSRATSVLIWLGPAANDSGRALDLFRRWGTAIDNALAVLNPGPKPNHSFSREGLKLVLDEIGNPPFDEPAFNAAKAFFSRDYWKRMWIVQELVLAEKALVLCGGDEVDLDHLRFSVAVWDGLGLLKVEDLIDPETQLRINMAYATGANLGPMQTVFKLRLQRRLAADSGQRFGPDVLDLVRLTRPSQATDPRDKIFAVYGMLGDQKYPVEPDYTVPVKDIYTTFTVEQINKSGRLDILSLAGSNNTTPRTNMALPTWVPDFSIDPSALNLATVAGTGYYADLGSTPLWTLSDNRRLTVRGIICDSLSTMTLSSDDPDNTTWPWAWWSLAATRSSHPYPAGIPWRQAVFRTLIADYASLGFGSAAFRGPDHEEWFLRRAEGCMAHMRWLALNRAWEWIRRQEADTGIKLLVAVNGEAEVTMDVTKLQDTGGMDDETLYWLRNSTDTSDEAVRKEALDAFLGPPDATNRLAWPFERYPLLAEQDQNLNLFRKATLSLCRGREFAVTGEGYFAMVPQEAREGDLVCVVFGCPIPMLLRKVGPSYVVVGEVAAYGMMQGEMMEEVRAGRLVAEDFELV